MRDLSTMGEGDGWVFWSRVYEDVNLRHTMNQKSMNPTMAQLLASPLLGKSELVFLNVPRMGLNQTQIIRQLISHHVKPNITILDITITNRRWILKFAKKEDAVEVMTRMDNVKYRGKPLVVRINNNECNDKPEPVANSPHKLFEKLGIGSTREDTIEPVRMEKDAIWTGTEINEINSFKRELMEMLLRKEGAVCSISQMEELGKMRRKGIISDALNLWPLGIVRMFSPDIRLTGRYMSVLGRDDHPSLIRKASSEGPLVALEEWEAIPSHNVRNDFQLVAYAGALLSHYGPQHVFVDIPWRLLCHSVRSVWKMSPLELAEFVVEKSSSLLIHNEILYQTSSIAHRRALTQTIVPSGI
ncbi:hypothetical protein PRIPAC_91185 [Pristionchus pacificus]|uniref:Uncharacterized protein n=1 Tax=Pristionchus pacificus TaxID=54126 RepID=A0A2A6BZ19_PRIPA|nr:hypothetical protein PRIPAC_91185 [Pristionchus pacificus]|eukprot:PDM71140.1 hypothetical protein PRIPAC_43523 [Pristionchus pacificus]